MVLFAHAHFPTSVGAAFLAAFMCVRIAELRPPGIHFAAIAFALTTRVLRAL